MCSHFDAASPSNSHNVGAAFRRSIRKEIQGCVRSNVLIHVHPYYTRKSHVGNGKINPIQSICPQKCPSTCLRICRPSCLPARQLDHTVKSASLSKLLISPSPCRRVSRSPRLFQTIPCLQNETTGSVFADFGGFLFREHAYWFAGDDRDHTKSR